MPKAYPAEFRRKVLDLVTAGRSVAQVADDLQISQQVVYTWRRQGRWCQVRGLGGVDGPAHAGCRPNCSTAAAGAPALN